jgi:hypothetical protein
LPEWRLAEMPALAKLGRKRVRPSRRRA